MANQLSKLGIVITADNSDAMKKMQGTLDGILKFTGIGTAISGVSSALSTLGNVGGYIQSGIGAAQSVLAKFGETANRLGRTKDLAEQFGLASSELIGFERSARMAGASAEVFQKALGTMRSTLGDALNGGANPFAALSLDLEKLKKQSTSQQLGQVFDALNKIQDPARRQGLGDGVFGSKVFRSLDLLSRAGSAGLRQAERDVERLGLAIDEGMLQRIDKADDAWQTLSQQFQTTGDKFLSAFAPALERVASSVSDIIGTLSKEGGSIDKMVSRLEGFVEFGRLYLEEAKKKAGEGAARLGGAATTQFPKWMSGSLGTLVPGLIGVGSAINDLGSQIERRNKLDKELRKFEEKTYDDADKWGGRGLAGALDVGTAAAYKAAYEDPKKKDELQKKQVDLQAQGNKKLDEIKQELKKPGARSANQLMASFS